MHKASHKQVCIPVRCVPPACLPSVFGGEGGVASRGCIHPRGCIQRGVCIHMSCVLDAPTLPPMDRMTDTCENITFPQLRSRTIKTQKAASHFSVFLEGALSSHQCKYVSMASSNRFFIPMTPNSHHVSMKRRVTEHIKCG